MKKATKKAGTMFAAFLVFSFVYEFKDIIDPPPLSKARERMVIKASLLGIGLLGYEIFAKE